MHDLVCEKRRRAAGLTSLEVTLRLLFSSKTTVKARRHIQTLSWKLWLGVRYAVQNGPENCEEQGYATEHQPEIADASDQI